MSVNTKQVDEVSALAKKLGKHLKTRHGISVPHSALRDCLAVSAGLEPHALKGRSHTKAGEEIVALKQEQARLQALVEKAPYFFHPGYDFDGQKLQWLVDAGLVEPESSKPCSVEAEDIEMVFWLAARNSSGLPDLSLDPHGRYPLRSDWVPSQVTRHRIELQKNTGATAQNPLTDILGAVMRHGLGGANRGGHVMSAKDTRPTRVVVRLNAGDVEALLNSMSNDSLFKQEYACWVSKAALASNAARLSAFCRAMSESPDSMKGLQVVAEWVYPDEDSDDTQAILDLSSGEVVFDRAISVDAHHTSVRRRIWVQPELKFVADLGEGQDIEVNVFTNKRGEHTWVVPQAQLEELRAELAKCNRFER